LGATGNCELEKCASDWVILNHLDGEENKIKIDDTKVH
jgi:hypothetical protein